MLIGIVVIVRGLWMRYQGREMPVADEGGEV
jgi:hypothetical protein